jgi:hypothetical protein
MPARPLAGLACGVRDPAAQSPGALRNKATGARRRRWPWQQKKSPGAEVPGAMSIFATSKEVRRFFHLLRHEPC